MLGIWLFNTVFVVNYLFETMVVDILDFYKCSNFSNGWCLKYLFIRENTAFLAISNKWYHYIENKPVGFIWGFFLKTS